MKLVHITLLISVALYASEVVSSPDLQEKRDTFSGVDSSGEADQPPPDPAVNNLEGMRNFITPKYISSSWNRKHYQRISMAER